jgi:hypothetical protein
MVFGNMDKLKIQLITALRSSNQKRTTVKYWSAIIIREKLNKIRLFGRIFHMDSWLILVEKIHINQKVLYHLFSSNAISAIEVKRNLKKIIISTKYFFSLWIRLVKFSRPGLGLDLNEFG